MSSVVWDYSMDPEVSAETAATNVRDIDPQPLEDGDGDGDGDGTTVASSPAAAAAVGPTAAAGSDADYEDLDRMPTGLVYDQQMCGHSTRGHPERPERIRRSWVELKRRGLRTRCEIVKARPATDAEIEGVHTLQHRQAVDGWPTKSQRELDRIAKGLNSIYLNKKSSKAARLAAGSVCELTKRVVSGDLRNGAAIVRPPGHHAETHCAMGFCIFNSVAMAAQYAVAELGLKRVLIVDWDVHHGNGTQRMFEDNPNVLYFSAHRYDGGVFYPCSDYAAPESVGSGAGAGFSVNVGWNTSGLNDMAYLAAFRHVLMPIALDFKPQLVLVSAGFDAAAGDPLGGCSVLPEGYAHLTHMLSSLAGGKVVVALEGGYNVVSVAKSMAACVEALLGDPCPDLVGDQAVSWGALASIQATINAHLPHWRHLVPIGLPPREPAATAAALTGAGEQGAATSREEQAAAPAPAAIDAHADPGPPQDPATTTDKEAPAAAAPQTPASPARSVEGAKGGQPAMADPGTT